MKLIRCHVENFGTLSGFDFSFEEGLNVLEAPNGFGKSTFAAFLKAMFYGFPRTAGRDLDSNERKKYTPWQGGTFGGWVEFEAKETIYRVERSFGKTAAKDTFALFDVTNHRADCDDFSERLGEELFGLDADSFERSAYLPQNAGGKTSATTSIQAKLNNLVEDTDDLNNFDTAMEALRAKRTVYRKFRGNGGLIDSLGEEAENSVRELRQAYDKKESLAQASNDLKGLEEKKAEVSKDLSLIREQKSGIALLEHAAKSVQEKKPDDEAIALLERGETFFSDSDGAQEKIHRAQEIWLQLEAIQKDSADWMTEREQARLVELQDCFQNGLPSEEDFSRWNAISNEIARMDAEKDALIISASETAEAIARMEDPSDSDDELDMVMDEEPKRKRNLAAPVLGICGVVFLLGAFGCFLFSKLMPGAVFALLGLILLLAAFWISVKRMMAERQDAIEAQSRWQSRERDRFEREKARQEERDKLLSAERSCREKIECLEQNRQEKISQFNGQLQAYEVKPSDEDLRNRLVSLRETIREYQSLLARQERDGLRREERESREKAYEKELADVLRWFQIPFAKETVREDLRSLQKNLDDYKNAVQAVAAYRAEEAAYRKLLEEKHLDEAEVNSLPSLDSLMIKEQELEDRRAFLESNVQSRRSEIQRLQSEVNRIPEMEDRRDCLLAKRKETTEDCEVLDLTMQFLEEARTSLTTQYVGSVESLFLQYAKDFLSEELQDVFVEDDLSLRVNALGEMRETAAFSAGTKDAIALCMRLALIDALFADEKPFLILDDPFVNLDDEYTRKALEMLDQIANSRQVVYMICNSSRKMA